MRLREIIGEDAAAELLAVRVIAEADLFARWKRRQRALQRLQAARANVAQVMRANRDRLAKAQERVRSATANLPT